MTGPELAAAFGGCLIGVALGALMMVWRCWRAVPAVANLQASLDAVGEERDNLLATLQAVHLTLDKHVRRP